MRTLRKRVLLGLATLALLAVAGSAVALAKGPGGKSQAPDREWVQEVFNDYANEVHAGPGKHPTTESNKFHLTQGGIKWFSGSEVEYDISGTAAVFAGPAAVLIAEAAIESAEMVVDGFVVGRSLKFNSGTTQVTSQCTGAGPNAVQWVTIDGPASSGGGVLARTIVCRNTATKQISGFQIQLDKEEPWVIGVDATKFDVQNIVTHEFGHVAGLGHRNSPKDGCLTMYRFVAAGEIQKRTLGLGDKLGMERLYGLTDVTPGDCGA